MKNCKFRCRINAAGNRIEKIYMGRKVTENDGAEYILFRKTSNGFIMKDENVNDWADSINDAFEKSKTEMFEKLKNKIELANNDSRLDAVTKDFMRYSSKMKEV